MYVISLAYSEDGKLNKLSSYMKTGKFPEQCYEGKIEKKHNSF